MHLLPLLVGPALALHTPVPNPTPLPGRPDEGVGYYAFDASDDVTSVDGPAGTVRVHYSRSGPNVTLLDDDDGSGIPDFAEEVAATAEDVLVAYEALGFRPPVSEADMGLGPEGGSPAFDFYLVDFGGDADGMFSVEACDTDPNHCAGYMVMENDFKGYGYSSTTSAIRTLTSHELFHAVQMAYESGSPVWYTEGMAVWAERQFDPENEDFIWLASAYLSDVGRPIDQPPTGPVPTFAYATCLFWQFLTERLGADANLALQEAVEWDGADQDTMTELVAVIEAQGSDLRTEWKAFTRWNLATGYHAGGAESYPFADELDSVPYTLDGETLQHENRFYPVAASYYRLAHPGGPLWFSHTDDATGLYFALFPVQGGETDGVLEEPVAEWEPEAPTWIQVSEDLPAGGYWLLGTYPENAANSQKVNFCLGDEETAAACLDRPADTGDTGTGDGDGKSCGCAAGGSTATWGWLLAGLAAFGLRRRRHPA